MKKRKMAWKKAGRFNKMDYLDLINVTSRVEGPSPMRGSSVFLKSDEIKKVKTIE